MSIYDENIGFYEVIKKNKENNKLIKKRYKKFIDIKNKYFIDDVWGVIKSFFIDDVYIRSHRLKENTIIRYPVNYEDDKFYTCHLGKRFGNFIQVKMTCDENNIPMNKEMKIHKINAFYCDRPEIHTKKFFNEYIEITDLDSEYYDVTWLRPMRPSFRVLAYPSERGSTQRSYHLVFATYYNI